MPDQSPLRCFIIGGESLAIRCAEVWIQKGHELRGVVSSAPPIRRWAEERNIAVVDPGADLAAALGREPFDYLFSVTNLTIIPADILALPRRGAINFHDGPLPRFAGLNAPVWALLQGASSYGVTWHLMNEELDRGDILKQRLFPVSDGETALTLNAKSYEAGYESFAELIDELTSGRVVPRAQDFRERTYFARDDRPPAQCTVSWRRSAVDIDRLVRALDFGGYPNPIGSPKILIGRELFVVRRLDIVDEASSLAPGTIVDLDDQRVRVATGSNDVIVREVTLPDGRALPMTDWISACGLKAGITLGELETKAAEHVTTFTARVSEHEGFWVARLATLEPVELPRTAHAEARTAPAVRTGEVVVPKAFANWALAFPGASPGDVMVAAFAAYLGRICRKSTFDLGYRTTCVADELEPLFADIVPLRIAREAGDDFRTFLTAVRKEMERVRKRLTYARDVVGRFPALGKWRAGLRFPVAVSRVSRLEDAPQVGDAGFTFVIDDAARCRWVGRCEDPGAGGTALLGERFPVFLEGLMAATECSLKTIPLLTERERREVVKTWNDTKRAYPADRCLHQLFEAQVARTPDRVALVYRNTLLTYRELDTRANQVAHRLMRRGVGPDVLVGVCVERSSDLLIGVLGVLKAGGAYVPIDPGYPIDRIALMLGDAHAPVLLTQRHLVSRLDAYQGTIIALDGPQEAIPDEPAAGAQSGVTPEHLAYVIYTSGSTGQPKGVMVEHRNVMNFFAGIDERLGEDGPGVWLAVTSLSFDISVLELFWTLARGFTIVLYGDEARGHIGSVRRLKHADKPIDFSLFYFAADESNDAHDRYRLLLEGARFADRSGFSAVWTPERHFHAFGGLYPNPAVTGAAVAAVTEHVQIRAGSCVLPLHHPIRVAEEWAVVDNLSRGRVGISFASGWQPNDFVLRPESFADAKQIMLRDIETVRRLWRGDALPFPGPKGEVAVRIHPRPVRPELPVWITTAGSPDSFVMAGKAGANVLTHLLGQSVEELGEKLNRYRRARAEQGHEGAGYVTLMLHAFVGDDEAWVRETVRRPLTEYLRTSAGLIKQFASAFPAFQKRAADKGVDADAAFRSLSDEELNELLAHSFERYYETSGLLGTVEKCSAMVDTLKGIGVDEVACLIDFGVDRELALAHLRQLDVVRAACQPGGTDGSVAAQITRHGVTHLQCTPSLAGMLVAEEPTRRALRGLRKLLVGGEALPATLASELRGLVGGDVLNMYGPTETTVWSASYRVDRVNGSIPIGRPMANTELYVLDEHLEPVPPGFPGELCIGGAGVVRGYLRQPELTAQRFVSDPFSGRPGARLYRTGDLARHLPDGNLEFLGRIDHQVKVRGYRVELGEIEAVLRDHPGLRDAIVVLREDKPGDRRLVAYVVPRGEPVAVSELLEYARRKLPDHMVPSHFVPLATLPLTPNGKIERQALPAPRDAAGAPSAAPVSPENELERTIAAIWCEVLNVPEVGVQSSFFDLGGHSLLIVQVHRRLREAVRPDLSLTDLFRLPTVRALSAYLGRPSDNQVAQRAKTRADARRGSLQRRRRTDTGDGSAGVQG